MTLTYIFHSGFALETSQAILVFDYWLDPADVLSALLQSNKPMYVFSSHFHEDHFTRTIFEWKKRKSDITYILSKDILKHRRAMKEEADVWLGKWGKWNDNLVSVKALGSTDVGVSWIVETDGKRIFHAGDLNNWYARFLPDAKPGDKIYSLEMDEVVEPVAHEKRYLGELKEIHRYADSFDVVMFPWWQTVHRAFQGWLVRTHAFCHPGFRVLLALQGICRRKKHPLLGNHQRGRYNRILI